MHTPRPWNSNENPIQRFRQEMDGMFSRFFNDSFMPSLWKDEHHSFMPKCNIEERNNHFLVEVEVPGVDPKGIEIELEGHMLTIKDERKRENKTEDKYHKMHVFEQSYGSFYRSFTLPSNIDPDNIKAENKNGILYIKIPKIDSGQRKRIEIQ